MALLGIDSMNLDRTSSDDLIHYLRCAAASGIKSEHIHLPMRMTELRSAPAALRHQMKALSYAPRTDRSGGGVLKGSIIALRVSSPIATPTLLRPD
jgi:hypothetical protein